MTPLEEKAILHVKALLESTDIPLGSARCQPGNTTEENWQQRGRDTIKDIDEAAEKIREAKGWLATLLTA